MALGPAICFPTSTSNRTSHAESFCHLRRCPGLSPSSLRNDAGRDACPRSVRVVTRLFTSRIYHVGTSCSSAMECRVENDENLVALRSRHGVPALRIGTGRSVEIQPWPHSLDASRVSRIPFRGVIDFRDKLGRYTLYARATPRERHVPPVVLSYWPLRPACPWRTAVPSGEMAFNAVSAFATVVPVTSRVAVESA